MHQNRSENSVQSRSAYWKVFNFAALVLLALCSAALAAPQDTGIVLMHGKWGAPRSLQPLARTLEGRGYRVVLPEMAWSGRRLYDIDYPAALREVEHEVQA